jgi:hypothetical protein
MVIVPANDSRPVWTTGVVGVDPDTIETGDSTKVGNAAPLAVVADIGVFVGGALNVNPVVASVDGKAENGPFSTRLILGRPLVLPVPPTPLLHADERTFAPCRLFILALVGVMAEFGSSAQNACLVEGVMAD